MWELNSGFIERLSNRLQEPLPGPEAHLRLSPQPVIKDRFVFKERPDAREGAVLILLHSGVEGVHFPLIQRPEYTGAHGGQISLPGGKRDPDDENLIQTALREANEEIGAEIGAIEVLGHLSELYIPASNFKVLPVIAITRGTTRFIPDQKEVADIISADIDSLMGQKVEVKEMTVGPDIKIRSPYFLVEERVVWGATAMMLGEFIHVLEEIRERRG